MIEIERRAMSNLNRLKTITPKTVSVKQDQLVKTDYLRPGETLPLVVRPGFDNINLINWTRNNREFIEKDLLKHGAILFRGFNIQSTTEFEQFAQVFVPELLSENGEHPRKTISGNVYTPVFYPADKRIWWHNENSFNYRWPMKIWFGCVTPAQQGGETPLVDARRVFNSIDPEIREKFIRKKVMYVRNYGRGLGLDWQTVFRTSSKSDVEKRCREDVMDFKWKEGDQLMTRAIRPAVVKHPKMNEMTWFNQAQHWHVSCLDPATRESMMSLFTMDDLPRNCYYGDGSVIEDSVMDHILETYRKLESSFLWQKGDVLMVENLLTAHGRNPFVGERKHMVAMGEMLSYGDVDC